MKLKKAILAIMDRDTLKNVVDDLEIEEVDGCSVEAMRAKVSRSRRATPEVIFEYLSERQARRDLKELEESGFLERVDAGPTTAYERTDKPS